MWVYGKRLMKNSHLN